MLCPEKAARAILNHFLETCINLSDAYSTAHVNNRRYNWTNWGLIGISGREIGGLEIGNRLAYGYTNSPYPSSHWFRVSSGE